MHFLETFRFIYLLGFVNAIFFSVLILLKKKKQVADNLLAAWLLTHAATLIIPFVYLADLPSLIGLMGTETFLMAFHPIILYHYVSALTKENYKVKRIWIDLIPGFLVVVSMLPYFGFTNQEKLDMVNNATVPNSLVPGFVIIVFVIVFYLVRSIVALRKHKVYTLQVFSYSDDVDLHWLRKIVLSYTGFLLLSIPIGAVLLWLNISLVHTDYIYYSSLVILIFLIGFWGYQQGRIFNQSAVAIKVNSKKDEALNSSQFESDRRKVEEYMQKHKPFLNPVLTIHELAEKLNMSDQHLSKIINKAMNCNFFEFINLYRIEHFKELLSDKNTKDFTLLGLAFDSGFNSKSAFNRILRNMLELLRENIVSRYGISSLFKLNTYCKGD